MSRLTDIITDVRAAVADPNGDRWSTERLLSLISRAQDTINKRLKLLRGVTSFMVVPYQYEYELPSDVWVILRASLNDQVLCLTTYDALDREYGDTAWQVLESGEVTHLVYDLRNMDEIRVFPIPNLDTAVNDYNFESGFYGVVTEINDYSLSSDYGVVTGLYDPSIQTENFIDTYGVITGLSDSSGQVFIWYIKNTTKVRTIDDELEIPTMWDTAITYFVISQCYDDDHDSRFAEKSAKNLALFEAELVNSQQQHNNVRSPKKTTIYKTPF